MSPFDRPGARPAWGILSAAAALQMALHAAALTGYGIFRDELYYLSCASRPGAGYVDQPPLSILFLAVWRSVFGDSLASLRTPPLLLGAATVMLTGLLAFRLGGSRAAQGLAALAAALAPISLGFTAYFSMNSFDLFFWALAALLLAALSDEEPGPRATRLWAALGIVLGLGLENKISVLWLGMGLAAGLAVTPWRRWLRTRGPYLAAALAGILFLPYVLWEVSTGWPTLDFMRRAAAEKYTALSLPAFLRDVFLTWNPVAAPVWIAGLVWLLVARDAKRFRIFGAMWLTVLAILLANRTSKAEYLAAAMAPLLAAGGVALERALHRGRAAWPALSYATVLLAAGLALAPMSLPLLPVDSYLAYARAIGISSAKTERHEMGPLPQHFADRFGWPEMAAEIARVVRTLSEEERRKARVWAWNYGEAGALERYGRALGVPPVLCPHNSFYFFSLDALEKSAPFTGPLLVFGGRRKSLESVFARVEEAGRFSHPLVMPYENGRTIWICRDPKEPLLDSLKRDPIFI